MKSSRRLSSFWPAGLLLLAVLVVAALLAGPARAVRAGAPDPLAQANPPAAIPNETCLGCHGQPGATLKLQNGEEMGLYVPAETHAGSVHGQAGIACAQCHSDVGNYPHPPFQAADLRDASLKLNNVCQQCHTEQFSQVKDSVHAQAQAAGNRNAAVCTDCHSAHAVQRLTDPASGQLLPESRVWIPQTCSKCHFAIYEKYKDSVHGSALIGEGNPDVPTCVDCHGVHTIEDPTTAAFRLNSPNICAKCHTDPQIMGKYGISTAVLETYVADFHGTTVTLFEKQHPDQETNKPVCYDCHGVHDIPAVDDPQKGLAVKQNLLARCQECHPNASENFPTAWLSHYIPSPTKHPLVFTVNTFYRFFIPTVLGGMALLVALDTLSLFRKRGKKGPAEMAAESAPPAAPASGPVGVYPASAPEAPAAPPESVPPAAVEVPLPPEEAPPPAEEAAPPAPEETLPSAEQPPATDEPGDEEVHNG